jgi:hypothetical protein
MVLPRYIVPRCRASCFLGDCCGLWHCRLLVALVAALSSLVVARSWLLWHGRALIVARRGTRLLATTFDGFGWRAVTCRSALLVDEAAISRTKHPHAAPFLALSRPGFWPSSRTRRRQVFAVPRDGSLWHDVGGAVPHGTLLCLVVAHRSNQAPI